MKWLAVFCLGAFVACSSSTSVPAFPNEPGDDESDGGNDPANTQDADDTFDASAPDSLSPDCTGACATTAVNVTLNGQMRTLPRAQFGLNTDGSLHVEVFLGGDPMCPTESSPSPMYTLIIEGTAANVTATFLDLQGDVLTAQPNSKATAAAITNVKGGDTFSAFDFTATFAEGTASGHLYADRCTTLDE